MKPNIIRQNLASNTTIITKYYSRLTAKQSDSYNEVDLWSVNHKRLIMGRLEDLKKTIKIKYLDSLPKDLDGNTRIYNVLETYLKEHHYKLSVNDLQKYLRNIPTETSFKINELWFVPSAIELIYLQCFVDIIKRNTISPQNKTDILNIKNIFLSLLSFEKIDWRVFFEEVSLVEAILKKDPSGLYSLMNFASRDEYRHVIEHLSLQSDREEIDIAEEVLVTAMKANKTNNENHIGFFLIGKGRVGIESNIGYRRSISERFNWFMNLRRGVIYYSILFVLYLASVSLMLWYFFNNISASLELYIFFALLFIPILVAVEDVVNYFFTKITNPKALLKMNFKKAVPIWARTMVVIPTQLGKELKEPDKLIEQLESNYLNNNKDNVCFSLLLSFCDNHEIKDTISKEEMTNLEKTRDGIKRLNEKYAHGQNIFFVFFRQRSWNESEGAHIEWERKRGKLIEFNQLLKGYKTSFEDIDSDIEFLKTIKYIVTVDQGDVLPKDTVARLAATISHPLNMARIDSSKGTVTYGYGMIQPQISCNSENSQSLLSYSMCGSDGWDSYSGIVSNIYQDIFGSGLFMGKGIYSVDIMDKVLAHRFPENAILSHDHLEGYFARSGYASDIQIFEDSPIHYSSYTTRLMRWTRGDCQNLPWIFGLVKNESGEKEKNQLNFSTRFKILENALRSLFLPSLSVAILTALLFDDANTSAVIILSFCLLFLQPLIGLFDLFVSLRPSIAWKKYINDIITGVRKALSLMLFRILFLGHLSYVLVISIFKALYRMLISHKRLLEWRIFHHINISRKNTGLEQAITPYIGYLSTCFIVILLITVSGHITPLLILYFVICLLVPVSDYFYSSNILRTWQVNGKSPVDKSWFNLIAIKTWRFFDEMITEKTNYLPPDRVQLTGRHSISQMTSITNIGLYLLSLEVAHKSGYISTADFLNRSKQLLETMARLDRYKGHYYNWYNIKNLNVMAPKYISAVDSGNLVASLMTAEVYFGDILKSNIGYDSFLVTQKTILKLVLTALQHEGRRTSDAAVLKDRTVIYNAYQDIPNKLSDIILIYNYLLSLENTLKIHLFPYADEAKNDNLRYWANKSRLTVGEKIAEIKNFYPWVEKSEEDVPLLASISTLSQTWEELKNNLEILLLKGSLSDIEKSFSEQSIRHIEGVAALSYGLSQECSRMCSEMDFQFLYNKKRKLFHIGYNGTTGKIDKSHYDLLASESRLTSFVALTQNWTSLEHWKALSRPIAASNGRLAILSWGGSLFEYLFPQIFLETVKNSFMAEALRLSVLEHINYAKIRNIPWGISESCYNQKNDMGDYQYSLHGLPHLSLRPTIAPELVISPYSSVMALDIYPKKVEENLKEIIKAGGEGKFGFYEAIDYNKPTSSIFGGVPIRAFLSHHQSIILISIYNLLNDGGLRKIFNKHYLVKPVNYVLSEKAIIPKTLKSVHEITQKVRRLKQANTTAVTRTALNLDRLPLVSLLSNGKYRLFLTDRGGGFSQYQKINLTPWRADIIKGDEGNQIYIWDEKEKDLFSPIEIDPKIKVTQSVDFSDGGCNFERVHRDLGIKLRVGLIDGESVEYRILTVKNMSSKIKKLKIAFASEQILSQGFEDVAHPAFNRLKTRVHNEGALWLYSRRHMPEEYNVYSAHKSLSPYPSLDRYVLTSRRDFYGRMSKDIPHALTNGEPRKSNSSFDLIYGDVTRLRLLPFTEYKVVYLSSASFDEARLCKLLSKYNNYNDFTKCLANDHDNVKTFNNIKLDIEQKLLSLLLYKRSQNIPLFCDEDDLNLGLPEIRNRFGLSSDNPIITTYLGTKTSKIRFRELVLYTQALAKKGFGLNLVILVADDDGYYQSNLDFAQKLIFESKEKADKYYQNLVIVKVEDKTEQEILGLKNMSTLYIDLEVGSFINQIETEYKKA